MRGGTRRHGKGWGWFFSAPDPATGKRRFYSKNGFPTKKAAQQALSAELARFHTGAFVEPSKLTLQAFLLEQWFPAIEGRLRRSTRANYMTNLKVHVIPALGSLKLQRLTAPRIAAFYSELLTGGRRDGKGLAPKTVRNIHALLHRALKDATRWGYVPHNRADDVDPPHGASPQQQVWTPEQLRAFLAHVHDDRLYALWLLVTTTGMRRAELAGLRWSDIDFARARLTPRLPRVVVNYQVHESDTKTASGRRSLALDPATLDALREHRRRQTDERAIAEIGDDNDLLFTWPDGRPLHPDLITDWFQRHAKRAVWEQDGRTKVGLPGIRLHDVRHSYATAALAAGVPAKIVSERLGHANVQITLDTYTHVIPGLDEQAAATVARLILEGSDDLPKGSPGSNAANSAAKTGDAPHSGEEVRGEDPGETGGGGGI
ncbi:MAG TPA: tyrosine-type recombinase/integrase [bacterium]|nr:tyrosine-type recombinase/integrase [bacterium]